jgi:O-antigen/teichoic acid export membrane protein
MSAAASTVQPAVTSGLRRALGSSVPILTVAYGINALSNFLLTVIVGRFLGAAVLGTFALGTSVTRIFYASTELGVAPHLTRAVSRDRAASSALISLFVSLRLAMIPVAVAVAALAGILLGHGGVAAFCLIAMAQGSISLQAIYESVALAHERPALAGFMNLFGSLCVVIGCAVWFVLGASLLGFVALYAGSLGAAVASCLYWTSTRLHVRVRWRLSITELRRELAKSWPIGLSFLLGIAALRAPVLVLGAFGSTADVGAFAAVDTFVTAAAILQAAATNASFPRLASSYRARPADFRALFWRSNVALAGIGLAIGVFLVVFGTSVIGFVFPGKDFARMTALIPIVGWSTPVLLLVHHNILVFAAADSERRNVRFMVTWLILIAGSQLALVPHHGLIGAGWALLIGRALGLGALAVALAAARVHRGGDA